MKLSLAQNDPAGMRQRLGRIAAVQGEPTTPSCVARDAHLTKPRAQRTINRATTFVSAATAALAVGFCVLNFDVGYVAVVAIFSMIACAMIKGTS